MSLILPYLRTNQAGTAFENLISFNSELTSCKISQRSRSAPRQDRNGSGWLGFFNSALTRHGIGTAPFDVASDPALGGPV